MLEIGPRDLANGSVFVYRRDKTRKDRYSMPMAECTEGIAGLLDDIQASLLARALALRQTHTRDVDDMDTFRAFFTPQNSENPELHGGFAMAHWCEGTDCEKAINDELSVTIRCIPFDRGNSGCGPCVVCGKEGPGRVVFAKAY